VAVVAIIITIASIAIPLYQKYLTQTKWAKAIADVRGLKIAIEHCLSENNAVFNQCDELEEMKPYGITTLLGENSEYNTVALLADQAAIQITGKAPLADCILSIAPSYNDGMKTITWHYRMASGGDVASIAQCISFVKGSEQVNP
jgi:Tfp pilus assembly major pilin PilA